MTIVIEDDPILRLLQVILDPDTPPERQAALDAFYARYHDKLVRTDAGWRIRHRWCQAIRDPSAMA